MFITLTVILCDMTYFSVVPCVVDSLCDSNDYLDKLKLERQ